ncbi:TPA: amidohydrolase [Pseudomonas aeruginosa]|nr:amidohydrolase [Pseudomonas aeruginosa]HBO2581253.1 amidohydrolase [Pseudomonas aeruginosa]HBO2600062.1 amidohydrolase [Pseudomonas aeruginosa]HCK0545474.1 amidohydrolase [Pseudomonas aeruginosa]HEP7917645.1 amidohydrolase [Pseudomonas aeruginosa]
MTKLTFPQRLSLMAAAFLLSGVVQAQEPVTIFTAKSIFTMEKSNPEAQAVAVAGKRILSVGTLASVQAALGDQPYTVDETLKDKVVMPGFIEQHMHPLLGALTLSTDVISMEDWDIPGKHFKGARTPQEYLQRLTDVNTGLGEGEWLYSWGYHPLWHGEIDRAYLDKISTTRPIIIWDRSCHDLYLNTAAIKALKLDKTAMQGRGIASTQFDWDKGHWFENGAMELVFPTLAKYMASPERLVAGTKMLVEYLHQKGITAFNDPGAVLLPGLWGMYQQVLGAPDVPFYSYFFPEARSLALAGKTKEESLAATEKLVAIGPEGKVSMLSQHIKLFADGAIISQAMQMKDGYLDGHQGEWMMTPEMLETWGKIYWDAGYQLHIHVTGDLGLDVVLDMLERRMRENPRLDHRTVIVHFPNSTEKQVERIARLGAIVSANPYYPVGFANKFAQYSTGPERAHAMARNASVIKHGIPLSFHSDLPVAYADPLFLAWSAVNRQTNEGNVVAPEQRIDVQDAMRAITIEGAYSWRKEKELGSIAPGKIANFTVLEQSPYQVEPLALRDIPVWGTVFEGRVFPNTVKAKAVAARDVSSAVSPFDPLQALNHEHAHGDACGVAQKLVAMLPKVWSETGADLVQN